MRIFHSHSVGVLFDTFEVLPNANLTQDGPPGRLKVPAHLQATLGFSLSQIPVNPASKFGGGSKLHTSGATSTYSFFFLYMGVDSVHL